MKDDITNSLRYLHPIALPAFVLLKRDLDDAYEAGRIGQWFMPFESFRSPMRQEELLRNGQGVTNAGAWQSAHNYGLAVDFVPFLLKGPRKGWDWGQSNEWKTMRDMAKMRGLLTPYDWDLAHVVHPLWKKINNILTAEPKPKPVIGHVQ